MKDHIRFNVIGSTIILSEGPEIVGNITVPEPDHEVARVFFRGEKAASAALAEEIAAMMNERFAPINSDNPLDPSAVSVVDSSERKEPA